MTPEQQKMVDNKLYTRQSNVVSGAEWIPAEQGKPETYCSVIVAGILEEEHRPDSHEGFWCGQNWWSVRSRENDFLAKRRIKKVTHWMRRPDPPNESSSPTAAGGNSGAQDR